MRLRACLLVFLALFLTPWCAARTSRRPVHRHSRSVRTVRTVKRAARKPAPAKKAQVRKPIGKKPASPKATVKAEGAAIDDPPMPDPGAGPSAVTLLEAMTRAHKALGPVTIRFTMSVRSDGEAIPLAIEGTERRNDPQHAVTDATMVLGVEMLYRMMEYVNGDKTVTYDATRNEYHRGASSAHSSELSPVLANALKNPEVRKEWEKVRAEVVSFRGEPAWRVDLKLPRGARPPGAPVGISVIMGLDDKLARSWSLTSLDRSVVTVTRMYTRQSSKFPPEIFVFTPPEGAKEKDVDDPETLQAAPPTGS